MKWLYSFFEIKGKQVVGVLAGNLLIGIGIGIFKYAQLGNDPFSAMCLSLYHKLGMSYAGFLILLNSIILMIQFIYGRKYIGFGTVVNGFGLGYIVQMFIWISEQYFPVLSGMAVKLLVVVIGAITVGLGLSLYQTADAGIAPFDSLPVIAKDRLNIPYFTGRMILDGLAALTAFLAGGLIGIGTLVCAFGFGPTVDFFNRHISEKILLSKK